MSTTSKNDKAAVSVIALHCSGSGANQWRPLRETLASMSPRHAFFAPEHYGCDGVGPWGGERAFTLADEAARTVDIIDRHPGQVHLVGHSYGGGVALRAALERPRDVASITLYEPSAFNLLKGMGADGAREFAEILAIASRTAEGVVAGDLRGAATAFVDYWGGEGAFSALRPSVQSMLTRWVPKAPLDFCALIHEPTLPSAYAKLRIPTLVMRGEHAPPPTRLIAEILSTLMPVAQLMTVPDAGHMGPLTHADKVNEAIARHIAQCGEALESLAE
ncbi:MULTISPECIES: alpha/beta hydrolase [unclassified Caballeronia]|uniref:alpha/beta fold hydrolase n=1 Tax=unclassified Caballeronia TaxID=2646786 RepID=UPI00285C17E4|nr:MULTISPECIES: alpha/beta hydrolase [unclassified Caballeronia]MDR5816606.1 alpha/beta hydrolase [Caballeronia sp. LZ033]MDR5881405.1 alpha/beta hydrolase [Caballeronia sp. LZ032]